MGSFNKEFEDLVKDMYNAEKQLVKALPKMAKAAQNQQLKAGFEEHLRQTEEHVRRLEQVAEQCGFKPSGKVCAAMQGLVEEANEHLQEGENGPVMDAVLICCAQKVEHYEMANYGTAVAWAKLMGQEQCVQLLQQTLQEEEQTDEKLNQLAEGGINQEAMNAPEDEKPKRRTASRSSSGRGSSSRSKSSGTSRSRSKTTASR